MTAIIAFFTTTAIGRALAKIGAVVLAILTFGAWSRRQGRKAEQAKQAEARAKANTETVKKVLHETASDDPAADIRRRLRERAGKP